MNPFMVTGKSYHCYLKIGSYKIDVSKMIVAIRTFYKFLFPKEIKIASIIERIS